VKLSKEDTEFAKAIVAVLACAAMVWFLGHNFKRMWIPACDQQCHPACREWLE
jgi:hypothetical protein